MKIKIDGKEIEVEGKKTILEVARENGIWIPSLCDHPRLTPFTGCRLCLVEVKGRKGYPPSCGTYIKEGMEIETKGERLEKLRRHILELMLSEHPHACLICSEKKYCDEAKSTIRKVGETTGCVFCPNNGRCELQEVVETLKISQVSFPSAYRNFEVKKGDPFFNRNDNLCILCGRCVRVCHEIRGASVLSFVYRGSKTVVRTELDRPLLESGCQFCGACVDVCPNGALVERAITSEGLPDQKSETICPLCSLGCELVVELRQGRILRSLPSENGAVNRGQACLKGRFLIRDVIYSPRRILRPLIRLNAELVEVNWDEAFDFVGERLKKYKGHETALIASPQLSVEENFVFQKFATEVMKTENIDSSAHFSLFTDYWKMAQENGIEPGFNFKIEDLAQARTIFVIGTDIVVSAPIVWLELLKALKKGAKLITVNPKEVCLNRFSSPWLQIKPGTELFLLGFLSKILLEIDPSQHLSHLEEIESFRNSLDRLHPSQFFETTGVKEEDVRKVARVLLEGKPVVFLFGRGLSQHPWGDKNLAALWNLAVQSGAQLFPLGEENNSRGTFEIWQKSRGRGLTFDQIIEASEQGALKALYLAGPIPYLEKEKLEFLVLQDCFTNENVKFADAVLPATTFAETEGTFVNVEGRLQKFKRIIEPLGEARPDWWIISHLAQEMGHRGFNYKRSSEIAEETNKAIPAFAGVSCHSFKKEKPVFVQEEKKEAKQFLPLEYTHAPLETGKDFPFLMVADYSLDYYRGLDLTQEIKGLRMIRNSRWIRINPEDAKALELENGERIEVRSSSGKLKGLCQITETVPKGTVEMSFLFHGDSDFSVANLYACSSPGSRFLRLLPVSIGREK